ncbi:TraR/DksA C4-type zinc finger protein [Bacillus carboniphilus]|uniref:TraR/DksA C4-type zinc finger protein n=1 Tax=Bacillus carboniphilus TaxID=86663 RepID=A0ABY9JRU6_9BACI|nr:TraR/DksA C4-type zinc finger protein [Bacillus carboniphilus]WLR41203.1 TraR/DksA C4-type zinc finger protein [Bacillus carboniphilus]
MLSPEQISHFRLRLLNRQEEVKKQLKENDHFGLERSLGQESTGDLSLYDNHPADSGTELYEREKDIALNDHCKEQLHEIENALERINNGTYGYCSVCGKDIDIQRLKSIPTAKTCVDHTVNQPLKHSRPIEEETFLPPFGQYNYDDRGTAATDSEDIYQEVEKYGSSNTPSDFSYPPNDYSETYEEYNEPVGYVESFENFIGTDIEGKNIKVYPSIEHEEYESSLDEQGTMTSFGDLPAYEKQPYIKKKLKSWTEISNKKKRGIHVPPFCFLILSY